MRKKKRKGMRGLIKQGKLLVVDEVGNLVDSVRLLPLDDTIEILHRKYCGKTKKGLI